MLDTTRAVSTSTCHNAFKFDDRSISNAPYNAIAHAYRFDAPTFMNWLDSGHPLTQRYLPACKRTYFAWSWMLKRSRETGSRRRSYPCPNAPDACESAFHGSAVSAKAIKPRSQLTPAVPTFDTRWIFILCTQGRWWGHRPSSAQIAWLFWPQWVIGYVTCYSTTPDVGIQKCDVLDRDRATLLSSLLEVLK
ncbi:hypothetical protein FB451DRAFT_1170385 [Mycena latifolia]|nr:hypothetical protein FB451DRAFT_1170385 [Mycena latifolia]